MNDDLLRLDRDRIGPCAPNVPARRPRQLLGEPDPAGGGEASGVTVVDPDVPRGSGG